MQKALGISILQEVEFMLDIIITIKTPGGVQRVPVADRHITVNMNECINERLNK